VPVGRGPGGGAVRRGASGMDTAGPAAGPGGPPVPQAIMVVAVAGPGGPPGMVAAVEGPTYHW